jgi:TonB family protein
VVMTEYWKQWEGQVIADAFPLQQYLGGDGDQAVFLTEYSQPASHKAAIKIVIGSPAETETQLSRWSRAAKLAHPNLLRIYTLGRAQVGDSSLVYLVMEYADESLAQVIPVRPLSAEEARLMLDPTLSVLAYLHGQGLVHGHLKPGKIMATGECLKISSAALSLAGEHSPLIADAYVAPEATASPASDVWSLGITLVEALTQHVPPRNGAEPNAPVVPETIPQPFLEIARECLRSDPGARSTVADIVDRLRPAKGIIRHSAAKWTYGLAASAGLLLAAVVIVPRLIERQKSVSPAEPVRIPQSPSVQPPQAAQPAPKTATPPLGPRVSNEIVQRVLPEVPSQARRTIQGRVRVNVRVRVDPSGKVAEVKLDSAGPSKYFAQLALQAARRWKFAPVSAGDAGRAREWNLHFEFDRTGTRVTPIRRAR